MFKSNGNNISIPNNYVYTSNKGTEYMYLDGSWMNCSNLNIVESTHNFKMNKSAIQQICEHNKQNKFQIGKKYIFNESSYVYVGRNNFTVNGNLLSESINSRIKMLIEAEDESLSNLKPDDTSSSDVAPDTEVPTGYVYTSGKGKKYFKKNGLWYSSDTKQPINQSAATPLERAAKAAIDKHNQTELVKIGTEWKSKQGKSYNYVGNGRFISSEGKLLPPDISKKVLNDLSQKAHDQKNTNGENNSDTPEVNVGADDSQQGEPEQPSSQSPQGQDSEPVQSSQNSSNTGSPSGLEGLAQKIKASPNAPRIVVLLSRGDDVSLLAADILLSGTQNEAKQILNSLNNED